MMNRKLSRFGSLSVCVLFNFLSLTAIEQSISDNGYKLANSSRVVAQTTEGQIARNVYKKASPGVVTVKDGKGHGSGFVVSKDGLIITNAHVVDGSPSVVTVEFEDGRQVPADVMGFAKGGLDLAVLKIHRQKNLRILTIATPGSSEVGESPAVGDRVFTLGSPLDPKFKGTFTQGNITRIDKNNGEIQHNAPVFGGNSGGPLLNTKAEVIGVNTSIIPGSNRKTNTGMNFAIPVSKLRSFIAAARKGELSANSTLKKRNRKLKIAEISLNGQVLNGSLTRDNRFLNLYGFQGKAGQKLVIEMTSKNMNPALGLYQLTQTSTGRKINPIAKNDDRGAGDFNSQIITTLPANGVYVIEAKSSTGRQGGTYSLRAISQ